MRNVVVFTTRKDNLKHFRDHLPRCFQDQERGIREYIYIFAIYMPSIQIYLRIISIAHSVFGLRLFIQSPFGLEE